MIYCATCGSREVSTEEWRNVNSGAFVCSSESDPYCQQCESECGTVEERRQGATARLAERKRKALGCTCGADLRAFFPEGPDPFGARFNYGLAVHGRHCPAAALTVECDECCRPAVFCGDSRELTLCPECLPRAAHDTAEERRDLFALWERLYPWLPNPFGVAA